jgi:hypothetical protein
VDVDEEEAVLPAAQPHGRPRVRHLGRHVEGHDAAAGVLKDEAADALHWRLRREEAHQCYEPLRLLHPCWRKVPDVDKDPAAAAAATSRGCGGGTNPVDAALKELKVRGQAEPRPIRQGAKEVELDDGVTNAVRPRAHEAQRQRGVGDAVDDAVAQLGEAVRVLASEARLERGVSGEAPRKDVVDAHLAPEGRDDLMLKAGALHELHDAEFVLGRVPADLRDGRLSHRIVKDEELQRSESLRLALSAVTSASSLEGWRRSRITSDALMLLAPLACPGAA